MNRAAALAGAGAAFWLSAALTTLFQAPSYQLLKRMYSLGLLDREEAFAGSFPNPFLSSLGGLLALLGALTLALSLLLFFRARPKANP